MKLKYLIILLLIGNITFSQNILNTGSNLLLRNHNEFSPISNNLTLKDPVNNWSLNLIFSNNGFGLGATIFKQFNTDLSGFSSIFFTGAKDDREFDVTDIYGNTYTPFKVNRLFMIPVNLGLQYRMFREDVTDNLRPFINGGITPTTIIYTPYDLAFLPSFGKARAKYTLGAFIGIGMDYLPSRNTGLSLNVRYYYIHIFGQGIESLQDKPMTNFGGLYFVFSFNFMK
jgi:hypothetical protein